MDVRLPRAGLPPEVDESGRSTEDAVLTRLVDPGDSSWNQLLAELSRLSKIVEQSANDSDHESSSIATPELRER